MAQSRAHGLQLLLGAFAAVLGCRDVTTNLVSDPPAGAAAPAPDAAATDAKARDARSIDAAVTRARCDGRLCACDDGVSNDDDGLIDGFDPECIGPFDDDETVFSPGGPTRLGACRDCFWDDNPGSGDDGCRYPKECLEGKAAPKKGACGTCEVTLPCVTSCLTRTPNGCDCFGCCEVTRSDGSALLVALKDDCSLDRLDDQARCPRCVQNTGCMNPCGPCELCPGRTADQIAAQCASDAAAGAPPWLCDDAQRCNTTSDCEGIDWYCQLGCCLPVVL